MAPLSLLYGVIAMLALALNNTLSKKPATEIGSVRTAYLRTLFLFLFTLPTLLLLPEAPRFSSTYAWGSFFLGMFGYLPLFTFIYALRYGTVGVVTTIANSALIFTAIFSYVLFGQILLPWQYVGIVMTLCGMGLMSTTPHGTPAPSLKKSLLFSLLTCVLWGLYFTLLKFPLAFLDPIFTNFSTALGTLVAALLHLLCTRTSLALPRSWLLAYLMIAGFCIALANLLYTLGITFTPVPIMAAFLYANPLFATLFSWILYKERLHAFQYAGIFVILGGMFLLLFL
jgi:drug/metabolite transporter (DMT)-like permease